MDVQRLALDALRAAAAAGKWIEGLGEEQASINTSEQLPFIMTKVVG